jgi:hypothetical protein
MLQIENIASVLDLEEINREEFGGAAERGASGGI